MFGTKKEKRTVAIYARVSTEHEAQLNAIENQKQWYFEFVRNHPDWSFYDMYADEGITGTSAEKRPNFMRMMEDAKENHFDLIITREVSRFARNTVDTLMYVRILKKLDVEVYFINDSIWTFAPDAELRLSIMASLAQDESRKTSERVRAGQRISMENGVIYGNGNILGYDINIKVENGKKVGREVVLNEEQAKVVRLIFDMYLSGMGTKAIQFELERRRIRTAMGKSKWHAATIGRILRNSFYCGIIEYRKEYVADFLEQKKQRNFGEVETIVVEGIHPTIVSKEEYLAVQSRMNRSCQVFNNATFGRRLRGRKPKPDAWTRLLRCECGHEFSRQKWHTTRHGNQYGYCCFKSLRDGAESTRRKKGLDMDSVCISGMISGWKLDLMAIKIFSKNLLEAGESVELAKKIIASHQSSKKDAKEDYSEIYLTEKKKELEKLKIKSASLLDLLLEETITKQQYLEKKEELETKIYFLKDEINILEEKEKKQQKIKDYKLDLDLLYKTLENYVVSNGEKVSPAVVESYVEKIIVHKNQFDWYLRRFDENSDYEPVEVATLKISKDEARDYLQSFPYTRRLQRWQDITIKVYY